MSKKKDRFYNPAGKAIREKRRARGLTIDNMVTAVGPLPTELVAHLPKYKQKKWGRYTRRAIHAAEAGRGIPFVVEQIWCVLNATN